MYVVAIIGDLLSFIPVVNIVTDILTMMILWMMSNGRNKNIFSNKNRAGTLLTVLLEAIPFVSWIPTWTIRVYLAKRDDALGA